MNAPEQLMNWVKIGGFILAIGGLAFSGWNLYIQGKLREISKLWHWKDEFEKKYQADQLQAVKEFATKSEVKEAFDKLDHHLEEIRRSLDRLQERLYPSRENA